LVKLTHTEEDYLRAIFNLTERNRGTASTSDIARSLGTSAASVTDMIGRLSEKGFLKYKKYYGVQLSPPGIKAATQLIRSERLWKVFLSEKLDIPWERISSIAQKLKHVRSDELIENLSAFLDHPRYDPHGEAIPNREGRFTLRTQNPLFNLQKGDKGILVGVRNHNDTFLQFLSSQKLTIGATLQVLNTMEFDFSKEVLINGQDKVVLSAKICHELYVRQRNP